MAHVTQSHLMRVDERKPDIVTLTGDPAPPRTSTNPPQWIAGAVPGEVRVVAGPGDTVHGLHGVKGNLASLADFLLTGTGHLSSSTQLR